MKKWKYSINGNTTLDKIRNHGELLIMKKMGLAQITCVSLLICIAGILTFSSIMFVFHHTLSGFSIVVGVVAAAAAGWWGTKRAYRSGHRTVFLVWFIIFIGVVLLAIWISGQIYDVSYDGQAYQQEAIIQLKNGWNPVYDAPL